MLKLPISRSALKYYEETGYEFSFKEQAHFCYRDTPGLLQRIDILKELLNASNDEKLNNDIEVMIDYESGVYTKFMQNDDNRYAYVFQINMPDYRTIPRYFRTAQQAMLYNNIATAYTFQVNEIKKVLLMDDCDDMVDIFPATFKLNAKNEIIEYRSTEYDVDYDFEGPFEARFYTTFMKIDSPFRRGDIVEMPEDMYLLEDWPEHRYPLIILSDTDVFHKKYEAFNNQYDDGLNMLDYEDNCIPVLDCHNDFSVRYIRPFHLERMEQNEHYSEEFWDNLLETSKMVKSRYDLDKIKKWGGWDRYNYNKQ